MQRVLAARRVLENAKDISELQVFREHADRQVAPMCGNNYKHVVNKAGTDERKPDL